jgi:hypothetical protein
VVNETHIEAVRDDAIHGSEQLKQSTRIAIGEDSAKFANQVYR